MKTYSHARVPTRNFSCTVVPPNTPCPDCRLPLACIGYGSLAVQTLIAPVDVYLCPNSHVWTQAGRPEISSAVVEELDEDA